MPHHNELEFMEDHELFDIVDEYCENHPKFNNNFIESLKEYCEDHDYLTDAQREALIKIITKFKMIKIVEEDERKECEYF